MRVGRTADEDTLHVLVVLPEVRAAEGGVARVGWQENWPSEEGEEGAREPRFRGSRRGGAGWSSWLGGEGEGRAVHTSVGGGSGDVTVGGMSSQRVCLLTVPHGSFRCNVRTS